jgi:hypothetical protein
VLVWAGRAQEPPPAAPICDIDPRCHPEFVWMPGEEGRVGAIGKTKINMDGR